MSDTNDTDGSVDDVAYSSLPLVRGTIMEPWIVLC